MRKYFFLLIIYFISTSAYSQQKIHWVIEGKDTLKYQLIYKTLDSLQKNELYAYFEEKPNQVAIHKKYYLGKQSGVTQSYFVNGDLHERIIFQNGQQTGDYSRYNQSGQVVVKAQYKEGLKNGFYINRKENFQGRYRDDKKHGKWEYNLKTPEYKKEFYQEGELVEKRQIFVLSKRRPKPRPKENLTSSTNEDSLLIPFKGDTLWYKLRYVSRDSLPHPAMRKAFFEKFPNTLAHTKYIYNDYINGMYKVYYPNGKLYLFANYTAGLLDGSWKQYDEGGKLRVKGKYLDGLKVGRWEYNLGTTDYRKEKYRSGILKE